MNRLPSLAFLATLLLAPLGAAGADSDLWLHVRVSERDDVKVAVNLPFRLLDRALPMIDVDGHISENAVDIGNRRLSYSEMRELWLELRDGPDMEFVTVEEKDESVRVWKEDGFFFVRVRDRQDDVDVRMPLEVVDALLGREGAFDFEAALRALAEQGEGELVTVQGGDESVRVWVDRAPEAAGR